MLFELLTQLGLYVIIPIVVFPSEGGVNRSTFVA